MSLNIVRHFSDGFQVTVRLPKGKSVSLDTQKNDKIRDMKEKIKTASKMTVKDQTLIFNAQILEDGQTLNHYDIKSDDIIEVASKTTTILMIGAFAVFLILFFGYDVSKLLF